jgi:hypothetical protein
MIEFLWLVVLLGPAVLSHGTSLSIFMMLSIESVGLPSVVMWGDHGEIHCCGLSKVWNGGEGCDLHGLWIVMLESAKNWVLGVDSPRQHVSLRVQYGMTCLIIWDAVGSVPCSDEWEFGIVTRLGSHGARGAVVPRLPQETIAMLWYCVLPWQSLAYDP